MAVLLDKFGKAFRGARRHEVYQDGCPLDASRRLASGAVVTFALLHEIVSRGLAFFNQIVGIGRRGLLFKQILPEEKVLGRVAKPFDFALVSVVVK